MTPSWARFPKIKAVPLLYALLLVWMIVSMGYYVAGVIALHEEFFHFQNYARSPFDFSDDGQTLTKLSAEAKSAGLADGDVMLAINGQQFTGYFQYNNELHYSRPGQNFGVRLRTRDGQVKDAHIQLASRRATGLTLGGYIAFLTPILGVPLIGLIVGFWVVTARPRDFNAWLVLILLSSVESLFGNLDWTFWPGPLFVLLWLWNEFLQVQIFPALLLLGIYFPERWRADHRWPWAKWLVLAAAGYVAIADSSYNVIRNFDIQRISFIIRPQFWDMRVNGVLAVICPLIFLAAVFDKLRSASTSDARRRMRVLAVGSGLSFVPILIIFSVLPYFGLNPHNGWLFEVAVPFLILFPLILAYVVVVQRAMDVRILLRMGTKYLLARVTLIVAEIGIAAFLVVRYVVPMMQRREHQILNGILLTIIVIALFRAFAVRDSFSSRMQMWLDRKFFREAYNSEMVLSELAEHARQFTDKEPLIEAVTRRISEILHVPQIVVWLRGSSTFHLQQAIGIGAIPESGVFTEQSVAVQSLAQTNRPLTIYRDRPEDWFVNASSAEKDLLGRVGAELLLPLPGRERLIGLMALGPKKSEEPYTPTDLRVLQSLATQTGLALEITELARSLAKEAAQRERNEREMEIAREVQQRLFPQEIPQIAGVTLAGMCRPALGVGGDYYDLIQLDDGRLGFAIGDVSGKGISAALLMASLRASLRGMTLDGPRDLARMMQKVNRLVYEASTNNRYATFFFAAYDPRSCELRYVNAGHNPPMLIRNGQADVLRLDAGGLVVGLLPQADYTEQSVTLQSGDLLVAYTDGISEAMTHDDEEWGEERMLNVARKIQHASAESILQEVYCAADEFTAGAPQHDDMTMLIMKLN